MITGIIQARMGATRLPGKTLKPIEGVSLLGWTIRALQACSLLDGVVVATTTSADDDPVVEEAQAHGARVYRGDPEDVLARYLGAGREMGLDVIVRVSGDSPLFSPWVCEGVIEAYLTADFDYVSNATDETFPYGTQAEVFSLAALERSWELADLRTDHEHVTPALRRHPDVFSVLSVIAPEPIRRGLYRLCIDTPRDYDVVCAVFEGIEHAPGVAPDLLDVVALLDSRPDLTEHMVPNSQRYSIKRERDDALPQVEMSMRLREAYLQRGAGSCDG